MQKVVAAWGRAGPLAPPLPQVRLRVQRRDGSLWPAAEAVACDLGDVATITVETPQGRTVLALDRAGHVVVDEPPEA